mgnify:CR=1 FL=1
MNEQRILFKKASYLMDNEIFSHVKTKKGIFFNGMIRKIDFLESYQFILKRLKILNLLKLEEKND